MTGRFRTVFLTTDYPLTRGGLETYSLQIAMGMPEGMLCGIDAARPLDGPPPQPRSENIRYRFHHGRSRLDAFRWSVPVVCAHFFSGRANSFLHMQWNTALGSWLLRIFGFPMRYIVLVHGMELLDPNRPMVNLIKRWVLGKADGVVSGSKFSAGLAEEAGARKANLHIVNYGFDGPEAAHSPGLPSPIQSE